jgi:uncharacterized membrane protein YadS
MSYFMSIKSRASIHFPSLLRSIIIGLAAGSLSDLYSAPVMLFALLLGMSLNLVAVVQRAIPGIAFSSRALFRIGVALLGSRVVMGDILALVPRVIVLLILAVVTTFLRVPIARLTGRSSGWLDSNASLRRESATRW